MFFSFSQVYLEHSDDGRVQCGAVHGPIWSVYISKFQFARDTYVAVCPALQTRFKGKGIRGREPQITTRPQGQPELET